MARLLAVTLIIAALAQANAFAHAGARVVARPMMRTSTATMRLGGGKGGGSFFGRIGSSARKSWPSVRRGSSDGGAVGGGGGGDGVSDSTGSGASDDSEKGPFGSIWAGYNSMLDNQPILTKALTSFIGFAIGDILVQTFIEKNGNFDFVRFLRFSSFGFLIHGPTGHWFYGNLDSLIPGATARKVFTKVFIDQVLWNPIFGIMFFSYMAATEGKGPLLVAKRVKDDLMTQVTGSWKVWPLAHAINFAFIPTQQRVLYINVIQIGYNMFLSIIGNRAA